jgi:hypothetical protein
MGKPLLNGAAFLLVKMGVMPDSSGSFELKFAHQPNVHPAQLPRGLVLFVLIQKGPKKSRQKKASALQARLPGPLFCQAFTRLKHNAMLGQ